MSSSQDAADNPVAVNVVPMVDVIFCLCVFFMCSMKFKEVEGKFESWLPKDLGQHDVQDRSIEETRVALTWDEAHRRTVRTFGKVRVHDDRQLRGLLRESHAAWTRLGKPHAPLIVDPGERVPWRDVVAVIDLGKHENLNRVCFAAGRDHEAPARK
jgi:biopolymer transport protein ExbD